MSYRYWFLKAINRGGHVSWWDGADFRFGRNTKSLEPVDQAQLFSDDGREAFAETLRYLEGRNHIHGIRYHWEPVVFRDVVFAQEHEAEELYSMLDDGGLECFVEHVAATYDYGEGELRRENPAGRNWEIIGRYLVSWDSRLPCIGVSRIELDPDAL